MTRGLCGSRWSIEGNVPALTRSASWGASLYFDAATVGAGVEVACDKVIGAAVGAAAAGVAVGATGAAVEAFPALAGAEVGTAGAPLPQALTTALAAAIAASWRKR